MQKRAHTPEMQSEQPQQMSTSLTHSVTVLQSRSIHVLGCCFQLGSTTPQWRQDDNWIMKPRRNLGE